MKTKVFSFLMLLGLFFVVNNKDVKADYQASFGGNSTFDIPVYRGSLNSVIVGSNINCNEEDGCFGFLGYIASSPSASASVAVYPDVGLSNFSWMCSNFNEGAFGVTLSRLNSICHYGAYYVSSSTSGGANIPLFKSNSNSWGLLLTNAGAGIYGYVYPGYYSCPSGGSLSGTTCITSNCAADTCIGKTCFNGTATVAGTRDCAVCGSKLATCNNGVPYYLGYGLDWYCDTNADSRKCHLDDNGCAANACVGQTCFNGISMVPGTKNTDECSAPTGLSSTCNATGDVVSLKWNSVSGATGYNLRVDDPSDVFFTPGNDTFIDSYANNIFSRSVIKNKTYNWWVSATNGVNYSPPAAGSFTCACTTSCTSTDPSTMCTGQTAGGNLDGCGGTCPVVNGTKTDGVCCIDSTWTPSSDSQCSGTPVTQTSNCFRTQAVNGTRDCSLKATKWREVKAN